MNTWKDIFKEWTALARLTRAYALIPPANRTPELSRHFAKLKAQPFPQNPQAIAEMRAVIDPAADALASTLNISCDTTRQKIDHIFFNLSTAELSRPFNQ